ncbi:unnamed protein product [Effrenium voratum]|uniref:RAP domain-containing protein n=1 Tax=Effrenium voratum TaxID=2562239 RepID=A0AA36J4S1_9DINO|nr:unnamed protein product [Effrenium voratum]
MAKLSDGDAFGPVEGLETLACDPRLVGLLMELRQRAQELTTSRSMMRVVWALGKLSLKGKEVQAIIGHIALLAPPRLSQFSSQELSNMLWGLARMNDGVKLQVQEAIPLAYAVMKAGASRLHSFSIQCLTNSIWAVAKLGLRGQEANVFARECILQIHSVMFKEMSPQGLANSLWACAKLQCDREPVLEPEVANRFCVDAARRATASEDLLQLFFPQELSMALWGIAKLVGRRSRTSSGTQVDDIERFAAAVAREGQQRIADFSPQGVSIVAWALATLDLADLPETFRFFEAATEVAAREIEQYPPQAIANLCWALNRVRYKHSVLSSFGKAAALEAQKRMDHFSWQDFSGILSALMNLGPQVSEEVRSLAKKLVEKASKECSKIGTQAILNLALSAVRLRLETEVVRPLALGISETFAVRGQSLNDIDMRQWQEIQRYVGLEGGFEKGRRSNRGNRRKRL